MSFIDIFFNITKINIIDEYLANLKEAENLLNEIGMSLLENISIFPIF